MSKIFKGRTKNLFTVHIFTVCHSQLFTGTSGFCFFFPPHICLFFIMDTAKNSGRYVRGLVLCSPSVCPTFNWKCHSIKPNNRCSFVQQHTSFSTVDLAEEMCNVATHLCENGQKRSCGLSSFCSCQTSFNLSIVSGGTSAWKGNLALDRWLHSTYMIQREVFVFRNLIFFAFAACILKNSLIFLLVWLFCNNGTIQQPILLTYVSKCFAFNALFLHYCFNYLWRCIFGLKRRCRI